MKKVKRRKPQPINKKVRNARKINFNNIQFQSKLELYCYKKLLDNGIEFEYEPQYFDLIPKIEYDASCFESYKKGTKWLFGPKSKLIRGIKYKPDFVNLKDKWIIECKGYPNEAFPLKWKLFKHYLKQHDMIVHLYLVKNPSHVDDCITNILKTIYGRETIL